MSIAGGLSFLEKTQFGVLCENNLPLTNYYYYYYIIFLAWTTTIVNHYESKYEGKTLLRLKTAVAASTPYTKQLWSVYTLMLMYKV